jgi:O-antigen/teichoic acid export membrane protein
MPLLFAGVLYMYLGVADRTLVAWYLTPHDVGNLSLAGLVTTSIQFVPACLGTLFYPRIARCYGETGSAAKLRRYFWILLGASVAAVVPACVGIYFIIGPLTEHWLPKYTGGIPAAQVACLSSLGFMYIGVSGVIAVVRRNTPYVLAHLFALLFVWMLGGYLIRHGYGIMGAIWARAIAMLLLCAFSLGFAFWLTAVPGRAK